MVKVEETHACVLTISQEARGQGPTITFGSTLPNTEGPPQGPTSPGTVVKYLRCVTFIYAMEYLFNYAKMCSILYVAFV